MRITHIYKLQCPPLKPSSLFPLLALSQNIKSLWAHPRPHHVAMIMSAEDEKCPLFIPPFFDCFESDIQLLEVHCNWNLCKQESEETVKMSRCSFPGQMTLQESLVFIKVNLTAGWICHF